MKPRARLSAMLRLIDRYLIREILPYFLLALLLLTAIIFAHEASRFSELLVVSSRSGLPLQAIGKIMAALIPGIGVFTIPVSLLVGTLVGLGRLSGDSEIIALGASGMSRLRMLRPLIALALLVAAAMLYITFNVLPRSISNLNDIKSNQAMVFQGITTQIKPRVFEESIPKKVIYIEDIDRTTNLWHNIFIVDTSDRQGGMKIFTAKIGAFRQTEAVKGKSPLPELLLQQGSSHQTSVTKSVTAAPTLELPSEEEASEQATEPEDPPSLNRDKKRQKSQQKYTTGRFDSMTIGVDLAEDKNEDAASDKAQKRDVDEMEWSELVNFTPPQEEVREWRTQIHKRLAYPAACLVFALLGVGFGISHVRTGRSFGLLLGLAITIIYYLLALSGEHAAMSGKLPAWLGVWLANLVLSALGVVILVIQRRPGADAFGLLSSLRHLLPVSKKRSDSAILPADLSPTPSLAKRTATPSRSAVKKILASRWPQLVDRLVISDLLRFFVYIVSGFSVLFIIITLFQLLKSITKHNIEWLVVINYLFFLLPLIANYTTPLAALVAVMITFGVLQKTSQVVALKASGLSIFRLATPAIFISLFLAGLIFLNQDYIMPFTNPRQNNLRALIRSGQEPAQTFYQTTNQWLYGVDSRIFNYAYFNPSTNTFADLNVIDLAKEPFGIRRRLYARRAVWDAQQRAWVMKEGWERKFDGDKLLAYEAFKERLVQLEEQPDYFHRDFRNSQSLTFAELRQKIGELSRAGFDVLDLKIALQSKIAFPLTCLIMVLVGLPFSFSVGKRGALYGVAIGIAIGLAYWGTIGLFEQMGRYEILPPVLAAWGPNLLFGTGGIYLFLTSRT
ncbi:MAG: LptF/LptG family permease [Acidobacteria bacterium]|nr:LptF/LptG family permease [Acidobacteriota bacterium]